MRRGRGGGGRGGGGRGGWERKGEANCKDTRLATHVSLLIVTYIVWARGLHVRKPYDRGAKFEFLQVLPYFSCSGLVKLVEKSFSTASQPFLQSDSRRSSAATAITLVYGHLDYGSVRKYSEVSAVCR